jgi:SAM-dependent methyltransferase
MFLRQRAKQVEYFDGAERTFGELLSHYSALGRVNRIARFERPFQIWLPRLVDEPSCRDLSVLDLGAGDGLLGRELTAWAAEQGWRWRFTNLDLCPVTAEIDPCERHVIASVTDLPFGDASFDVVVASTMTHHLRSDADVVAHFREAARVAKRAVLICDMHRNLGFLVVLSVALWFLKVPREFRADAALSVRRGWRAAEWRRLADQAGLGAARIWCEHGTRIFLALGK